MVVVADGMVVRGDGWVTSETARSRGEGEVDEQMI
jgi:hypothetical protein